MSDFSRSKFFKYIMEEREEVLKHKWIESEKIGQDIGYNRARLDWLRKYKKKWIDEKARKK